MTISLMQLVIFVHKIYTASDPLVLIDTTLSKGPQGFNCSCIGDSVLQKIIKIQWELSESIFYECLEVETLLLAIILNSRVCNWVYRKVYRQSLPFKHNSLALKIVNGTSFHSTLEYATDKHLSAFKFIAYNLIMLAL